MTDQGNSLPEILVVVERNGIHQIEVREVIREGDLYFLLFARSDGSQARVPVDGTKFSRTHQGRVVADMIYQGGSIIAPEQDA
ncbi:hypothetical protein [Thermomonas haemolytica]|uniref:hypothetical protein n=1 Tax=Thermomonas haemolytica TaxID=141949 RepID=UPI001050A47C|nr:hypothetical protein [Thermomonas haemolytica]